MNARPDLHKTRCLTLNQKLGRLTGRCRTDAGVQRSRDRVLATPSLRSARDLSDAMRATARATA
jgi:hypothetical protein